MKSTKTGVTVLKYPIDITNHTWYDTGMKARVKQITAKFPIGTSTLNKIHALDWRILGCNHDTEMCVDLGDNEHTFTYCFRCMTKI